ncbi:MAG: extracellular solute-binding protein [Acidimicrobiia bacterium]
MVSNKRDHANEAGVVAAARRASWRRRGVRVTVAGVVALTAASCGSDDPESAATTAPSAVTASSSAPGSDSTAAAGSGTSSVQSDASWDAIVEAAKAEGSVMFYTVGVPALVDPVGKAFEAEYGIKFEYVRNTGPDFIAAVETELKTGKGIGDVIGTPDLTWLGTMDAGNNWQSLAELPNLSAPDFQDDWVRGKSSYILESIYANGWGYNSELYPGGPKSCDDLLDPKLDGLIGIIDPTYPEAVDQLANFEDQCGEGFLEKLGAQHPRIYSGSLPMVESLASGETVVNMNSSSLIQSNLVAQGAPLAVFQEDWNTRVIPTFAAVPTSAPHPNAALVFANFLISRAGNEARGGWPSQLDSIRGIEGHKYAGDFEFRDPSKLTPEQIADYQARFDAAMR